MLGSFQSLLGWGKEPPPAPTPPAVAITGIRIPADGTPAHLVELTTTPDAKGMDSFLFHVPHLRKYWPTELAWESRDLCRLDLLEHHRHVPISQVLRQRRHLQRLLQRPISQKNRTYLSQRHLLEHQYHTLHAHQSSCAGSYYVYHSYSTENVLNLSVPTWISEPEGSRLGQYRGDVFIVKMAPEEVGAQGWALYDNVSPAFLELLVEAPRDSTPRGETKWQFRNLDSSERPD
jgi:hypothetical protein